jgi:hypothetical protein
LPELALVELVLAELVLAELALAELALAELGFPLSKVLSHPDVLFSHPRRPLCSHMPANSSG